MPKSLYADAGFAAGRNWPGLFLACACLGTLLFNTAVAQMAGSGNERQIHTTLEQLLGNAQAARYEKIIAADQPLSWEVYLPGPGPGERPGVLVYISPVNTGQIDPRWRSVMDEHNMIYIAANDSGNKVRTISRMVMAVMAVQALADSVAFDTENIFISGFSGGGRVASLVASQYPEAFSGAIYMCGVDPWKAKNTPGVEKLIQNRFVFLTGSKDFNRYETRKVHKRYTDAGAAHTKLMVVPGMAHARPDSETLSAALGFLIQRGY